MNSELAKIKGKTCQKNILKDKITDCVKGMGWQEYHANWSVGGKQHNIDYLLEQLLHVIIDSQSKNKTIVRPIIKSSMRKKSPSLGVNTADVWAKEEKSTE